MPLTDAGRDLFVAAIVGQASVLLNAAGARLSVGNGSTAFDKTQVDLQGVSTSQKTMEAGFPELEGNIMRFKGLWGTGDANWDWNEVAVFTSDGIMVTRLVGSFGTKTNAHSWYFTLEVTVGN